MSILSATSLSYHYPSGKALSFPDLTCAEGENMLITGMSGSGKTSLLHLLSGILSASQGEVKYGTVSLTEMTHAEKDSFRGNTIGMVFQKHFFIDGISVMENLRAARRLAGNDADTAYLQKLTEGLGIAHLGGKKPSHLSEGEQQRFSIARALANNPSWILADEPTSSLDDMHCEMFIELMGLSFSPQPLSWIIATHDGRLKPHFSNVYNL